MSFRPSLRLAILALSAPLVVTSQELPDVASVGNGARAVGLSFATTALSHDVYAIGWNPAGLARLTRPELAFTSRAFVNSTSARVTDYTPTAYPIYSGGGEITGALDAVEFFGVAAPYRVLGRTVTVGVAYRHFTEGIRTGIYETIRRQANGRYKGSTKYQSTGGVRAISPSIGVEITPELQLGASVNVLMGSTIFTRRPPAPAPGYRTRELEHGGLAIELGALYQLRDGLLLGVHATLPHDRTLQWDNDTTIRDVTRQAPFAFAAGLALTLSPTSRASADVRHAPWSDAKYLEDDTGDAVFSPVGVNDASSVHVGYERDRTREIQNIYGVATGTRRTQQRIGLFARQSTSADFGGKPIRMIGGSAGMSWLLDNAVVDLGLLFSRSTEWTYVRTTALRADLHTNDVVLAFGIRRRF